MGAAYRYANNRAHEKPPRDLEMFWMIKTFGWEAAHTAPAGELRRMMIANNVYEAYMSRERSNEWGEWAEANPEANDMLNRAMMIDRERANGDS